MKNVLFLLSIFIFQSSASSGQQSVPACKVHSCLAAPENGLTKIKIKGKVTVKATDTPLIAAEILVKKTGLKTFTDFDGQFELDGDFKSPCTLVVSYEGFKTKELLLNASDEKLLVELIENPWNGSLTKAKNDGNYFRSSCRVKQKKKS